MTRVRRASKQRGASRSFRSRSCRAASCRSVPSSPMSVCRADQSVFWPGIDGLVYRFNGYTPQRVGTHAIEAIIGRNTVGLHALTHPYRGHWFYCLTTYDNRTLVYDIATGDGTSARPASTATARGKRRRRRWTTIPSICSAIVQQGISVLDMTPDDAGVTVIRQATFPPLWAGTYRAFCARVEIEMESGGAQSPGPVLLEWSDDGARTFNTGRTMSAGVPGDYRHRVYTTRLGSFRQRVFRVTCHGLTRLYAADADIVKGAH